MENITVTRHYVSRVNKTNGKIGYINHQTFNGLPGISELIGDTRSVAELIDDAHGYEDRAVAVGIVGSLNAYSKVVNSPYEYYDVRRNETTIPNLNNLSDDAKKWFEQEPEQPEQEPTE